MTYKRTNGGKGLKDGLILVGREFGIALKDSNRLGGVGLVVAVKVLSKV